MIVFRSRAQFDKEATVVLVDQQQLASKNFSFTNPKIKEEILALAQAKQFKADNGEIFPLLAGKRIVLVVGVGKSGETSLTALRITVRKALMSSYLKNVKDVEVVPHKQEDAAIHAVIEGFLIGTYVWKKYKSKEKNDQTVGHKNVFLAAPAKKIYEDAAAICQGVNLTRDLVNDNADLVTSTYLERVIKDLIRGKKNISVEILNAKELKAKGLNLHVAVNQGSTKEPKLIIVKYKGTGKDGNYTALLGKGMTYDTGGLNLKPTGHIESMRIDMSGAGAVIGVLKNTLALNLKKNIIFAVGIAENAISAQAYKPGDVISGYAGKSVEIGNTDAEGRLVLADALSYLVKNYKPARIIDLATLTGACVVALGFDYTGLFASDDNFAQHLIRSSNETDDRAWRLPIYPEMKEYIKSPIADLKNTSSVKGAGACTAAEFLHQFTEGTTWAHLDIAGSAFTEGSGRMYFGYGATGAGVRLVTHYVQNN